MGQEQSEQSKEYQNKYEVFYQLDQGMTLLKDKTNSTEYLLRIFSSYLEDEMNGFTSLIQRRQKVMNTHLIQIVQVKHKKVQHMCSQILKMYILLEYPFKTLSDDINQRRACSMQYFSENQLWSIMFSCGSALEALYCNNFPHECLTDKQILIDRAGLIKISDPLTRGLQKNYITILKDPDSKVYLSPQLMSFLEDCNFYFYDKQKSDIFILGAIILQCTTLQHVPLYDSVKKRPSLGGLDCIFSEIKERYSSRLVSILQKMLSGEPKNRITLKELLKNIQEDENKSRQKQQEESNKTIKHNSVSNEIDQTFPLMKVSHRIHNKSSQRIKNQSQIKVSSNPIKSKSLIHHLQSSSSLKIDRNLSKDATNKHTNSNSYFKTYSSIQQNRDSQIHPNNNNPPDPNQRFSYMNFGNITINYQPINYQQMPLYSHQIPQVNKILNSIKQTDHQDFSLKYQPILFSSHKKHTENNQDSLTIFPKEQKIKTEELEGKQTNNLISELQKTKQFKINSGNIHKKQLYIKEMYANGNYYEGITLNGMKNGQGKIIFKSGGFYEGNWKNNKIQGFGKMYYASGQLAYEGHWNNDEFSGSGKHYNERTQFFVGSFNCRDFNKVGRKWISYEGQFEHNVKNGKGKMILGNKEVFIGTFKMNTVDGAGTYYQNDGKVVKGLWKQNVLIVYLK